MDSAETFRLLFAGHPLPLWVYDLETLAFLEVNDAAIDLYGYTRDEFLHMSIMDIRPQDDESRLLADVRQPRPPLQHSGEWRHRRKDGQIIAVEITSHTLEFRGRAAVLVSARDITERRRLEQQTHAALDALLAMAEAIVSTGEEGEIGASRAAGERLAELTLQVLGCQHVAIVALDASTETARPVAVAGFSAPDAALWWRQWEEPVYLQDGLDAPGIARLYAGDVLILDGMHPPFQGPMGLARLTVLVVPLRAGSALTGLLLVDHGAREHTYTPDEIALVRAAGRLVALVIERERLLQESAQARANALALQETNRRMEEFLSIAGHELRTPLTSVLGNVQLAVHWLDNVRDSDTAQHESEGKKGNAVPARLAQISTLLRRMERQGRVLNRLVNDLLDTSRIEAGRLALRHEPADLAALVREVALEHQQQVPWRTLRLDVPATDIIVNADAERIEQVLTNYLSNALKYAPPDQPIDVGLRQEGTTARVWVQDRGPGLPSAEHDRVWDRFYRAKGITHQDGSSLGLGLGLHISRSIIMRHGGEVGVESAPGAGSLFWFTLPLAE